MQPLFAEVFLLKPSSTVDFTCSTLWHPYALITQLFKRSFRPQDITTQKVDFIGQAMLDLGFEREISTI
ncbi:MAG: hypothetical protein AAGE59_17655 [Cyanobacteria bacterium P01_F01_bin.86]